MKINNIQLSWPTVTLRNVIIILCIRYFTIKSSTKRMTIFKLNYIVIGSSYNDVTLLLCNYIKYFIVSTGGSLIIIFLY